MVKGNTLGKSLLIGAAAAVATLLNFSTAFTAPLAIKDEPLFLSETPPPLNMLVMSRDHRMYYEAYNDASDLDGDGIIDTTYNTDKDKEYYGYFESHQCYSYVAGVFEPVGKTATKKCSGQWSGDWLNYVTTSRIDALRKVLYGGLRSTDTAATTILQRAFIPQDAHSWGKEYESIAKNGYDIREYTPYPLPAANRRHLFANTTPSAGALQTGQQNPALNNIGLPLLRVLTDRDNRVWDWLSAERLVADTNIHSGNEQGGVNPTDLIVRVRVCGANSYDDAKTNCKVYGGSNAKPTGLLQDYGENDAMFFGLLSGSYGKPHDGGVLRKGVGSLKNELDLTTGVFNYALAPPGIINTIDRLRITNFNTDVYGCGWITTSSDAAGECSMWGNPTAEMMYEVVRYFAGETSPIFASGANNWEETSIGLSTAPWNGATNPYGLFPRCSKPFETVISDINPSYDSDKIPGSVFPGAISDSDNPIDAAVTGQKIWTHEGLLAGKYFIGESAGVSDGAPTSKTVSSFGDIRGLAPEAPTKEGSYYSASVAYYGLTHDLNDVAGEQKMQTFAVALASPLPHIDVKVGTGRITLVPFAKSVGGGYGIDPTQGRYQPTNQIVDFYVDTLTPTYGKFRVNFEDVEQGADHDMDAIAIYEYQVNGGQLDVTVTSEYAAGGIIQHMGYVITGTTQDGTYLEVRDLDTAAGSDVDYFLDTPKNQPPGGNWADGVALPAGLAEPATRSFTPASAGTAAGFLKDPLYYAAKWGGFDDKKGSKANEQNYPDETAEWDSDGDGVPDNYFLVTNALTLKDQLAAAFKKASDAAGSASSAAVSSGSINGETNAYQATFDARTWGGDLEAYPIGDGKTDKNGDGKPDAEGAVLLPVLWNAAKKVPVPANRKIFTVGTTMADGVYSQALPFQWNTVEPEATLKSELKATALEDDLLTKKRLEYLRGDRTAESGANPFRVRTSALGDIVDSAPVFVGAPRARYRDGLEGVAYSGFRSKYNKRAQTLYVGANDGMLHAFDAITGEERFGFIPRSVFANLQRLSDPDYSHLYYVNGSPTVTDAFYSGDWHTVLASGLNKGGQGIFALDVTQPGAITEGTANDAFMWEFTDATDKDLGYTFSRPVITKMHSGRWVAIFGNGYNNTDTRNGADAHVSMTGNAVLYIVALDTGELLKKLDTGVGEAQDPEKPTFSRPNGLSTPAVVDLDGDSVADYAYAGDLFGNLWKFDLMATTKDGWQIAYGGKPLYTAVNGNGKRQSITERPTVDIGPNGLGMVVLFGTGKFLESADRVLGSATTQSFYGVFDANTNITSGSSPDLVSDRSKLQQQTIIGEGTTTFDGAQVGVRITSNNTLTAGKQGWYIDLGAGEMQVTDPLLRNGRVLFTTLIPDTDPCAYGGKSWLMELDALSGARLPYSPFDFNQDKSFNQSDYVTVGSLNVPASGFSRDAIMSRPAVLSGSRVDYGVVTDTKDGGLEEDQVPPLNPGPGTMGRQSWRQLR